MHWFSDHEQYDRVCQALSADDIPQFDMTLSGMATNWKILQQQMVDWEIILGGVCLGAEPHQPHVTGRALDARSDMREHTRLVKLVREKDKSIAEKESQLMEYSFLLSQRDAQISRLTMRLRQTEMYAPSGHTSHVQHQLTMVAQQLQFH